MSVSEQTLSHRIDQDQANEPHNATHNGHGQEVSPDQEPFHTYQSNRGTGRDYIVDADHIAHGTTDVLQAHDQDGGEAQLLGNGELEQGKEHIGNRIGSRHKGAQGPYKGVHQRPAALEDAAHGSGHGNGHPYDAFRIVPRLHHDPYHGDRKNQRDHRILNSFKGL